MQVMILSASALWRTQLGPSALFGVVALLIASLAVAFAAGFHAAIRDAPLARNDAEFDRRAMLLTQQRQIDDALERVRVQVDALSVRTALLQGRAERIDALGAHLAEMSGLQLSELSFGRDPALAGAAPANASPLIIDDFVAQLESLGDQLANQGPKLASIERAWILNRVDMASYPSGRPVSKGWVSSQYGWRTDPITSKRAFHDGMDFAGRYKSPVLAVAAGIVTAAERRRGYGNIIEIKHPDGLVTRYAHNSKNTVAVGDKVMRGHVIALMGTTGRSTGAHVHFEVLRDGSRVNPRKFLRSDN